MSQSKKYIVEIMADKGSLENFKKQLRSATEFPEGTEIPPLSRESKAQIKKDLSTMFGVAEHQAEALQQMMQAVADGFASNKNVNAMKKDLKDTLTFINTIMNNMSKMGEGTDWMKQGVSFVDDFIKMKDSVQAIDGLERSVAKLNKSFNVFKDALAETNADAFLQRFGDSTRSEAESLAKAQKELDKIAKNRTYSLSKAIEKGQGEYNYTGWSKEKIAQEYKSIIQTIETANQEIENLRKQYRGKTKELYSNKDYQKQITALSTATHKLKNLPSTFGDGIDANFKMSLKEATDSVQSASNEIKNILDDLQNKGVELSITLPDASSEKFVSQINDFVAKATKQFKTKPISVFAEIKDPFKETKTTDGVQSNDIVNRFTESLKAVKEVVNAGYKDLTTLVNNDSATLKNALTLKFDYKKSANDEVITDALADMQNTIYKSVPLNIVFETENVAEKLATSIQDALKDIELPTFSVPTFSTGHFSAEQFSGEAIPVQIVGMAPMSQGQEQVHLSQPRPVVTSQVPPVSKPSQPKAPVSTSSKPNKPATKHTEDVGTLRITNALNKLLQGMQDAMQTQQDIITRETANIQGHSDNLEAHASDIRAAEKRNEIINKRLEGPNARKEKIQAEQKIIANKLQEARDAYATKYKELFVGDEYKKIRGLDEGFAILQENLQNTQQEYVDKLKGINKNIEETRSKMDKAASQEEKDVLSVLLKAHEAERSKINKDYTEKLSKLETSIAENRESYATELGENINAQKIDAELQPLRTAINDVATQLQAKKEELDAVIKEIQQIKVEVRSEQLNEQLAESTEHKKQLQTEKDELTTKHTQARSVYDEKYKEFLNTKDGAIIGGLDKAYEALQNNYSRIKAEYDKKIQKINDNIVEIQKRSGTSAVVDRQIPELVKAQEKEREKVKSEYTAELAKIEADMKTNRDSHADALRSDDNTSRVYGELQALKNAANDLADQLAAKQKELEGVLEEIRAIKQAFEDGEDLLGEKNPKTQIKASTEKIRKANKESSKIQNRTQMVQAILNEGENPSKYVLETTNDFWEATRNSIATAERSMMKRVTSDAMRDGVTQMFNQIFSAQENLSKISDQDSNEYKLAKAHMDSLMQSITSDIMQNYLTQFLSEQKKLTTLDPKSADYKQVQTNINGLIQNATSNMVDVMKNNLQQLFAEQKKIESLDPQSEDYKNTQSSIDELWSKIDAAAKALTGQDAKTFKNNVSRFKNAYSARAGMSLLGLNDMSGLVQEEAIRIVTELLSKHIVTSESVSNIGESYHLGDLSDYVGIAKTAMGVEDKTFAQYNKDIQAENSFIQLARNMEMLRQLYQAFPKDESLPSASTIEKFIQYFGGFAEMGDVVESAAKYLSAIQNINALKEDIPLLQTLDDSGILETQLPKIFKTIYGHLSDDDRQKLSTVVGGYGLKDADITKLDGDALVDAFSKMTTAFANNAFKDLDIQSPIFKQIEKLLSYNASVVSARKDLQDSVDYRRNYLQSATYTTQGRAGGPARTKTNNIYDVLQSNAPLNVRVVNDKDDYVASIYSPKGSPGEANRKYKANPIGLSNFAYEAGIKDEMTAIVAASLRETLLNNVSSMLASWADGYKPTTSEIFQLSSALPEEFNAGDFIDEDGVVIEIDELRKYVKAQKDDMVTASQLMRELVASGRIQVSLGKDSIAPDYAKKDDNYSKTSISEQLTKEKQLETYLKKLRNKDYSSLDKELRARITGDYSEIDDVTKARITGDYSSLSASDQKKARELGALLPINVEDLITDKQAELDALRKIRISTEKEIDTIIAIEDDLKARRAKQDKITDEKKAEESAARVLDRYGKNANQYKQVTGREKSNYKNGFASVDELLDNIAFAKSYGIGDVAKLEEAAGVYKKAIANKDALEESGATEEELDAAVKELDAAEKALIDQYFDSNGWKVIKHLQQQFANAKTQREASMRELQSELDAAESAQQKTESEINRRNMENKASINETQMGLSSKYLETPALDIDKQNREYEKAVADKRKEIEARRKKLNEEADLDPRIAKLRQETMSAMDTDEYKALRSEWLKAETSNSPEAKQQRKELKAKLDTYEQAYLNAKNRWVTTKSDQLDAELKDFISSLDKQIYATAYTNHETEIEAKKAEIEAKKKALTKDVNNPEKAKEVAQLKKKWKDLEAKAKTADEMNDRDSAIKLDNQALDAKERYETAKKSWIASQAASLDKELIDYIKQLELNDKTVSNFNADLPEDAKVASSIEDIRNYIRETYKHLLDVENERFKQELDAMQNGTSSIDVESRKKAIEKAEEDARNDAIKSVTKNGLMMTDTQLMAQQHRDAAAAKAEQAKENKKEIERLESQRKIVRERAQVEDEAIEKRRALIKEEKKTSHTESSGTTPTQQPSKPMTTSTSSGTALMAIGGQGFAMNVSSLVAELVSSDLASESTLRGIYEVLNGGEPKGGWDGSHGEISQPKGKTSGQPIVAPASDVVKQDDADKVFASSVSKILKQLSGRTTKEAMAFIGARGHIGKLIEGTKDGVPGNKISEALAKEIQQVFAMIHNHPSKIAGLSDIDLDSAVKYAYGDKPVKVHGTVANGLLTSVNFDGIDESTANAILGEYNKSLMEMAQDKTKEKLFGLNKDGRFAIKNLGNDPELQKQASDAIYDALKNAFTKHGHGNAVQQVGIDNLSDWKDSVIPKVQQPVEPVPTKTAGQAVANTVPADPVGVPVEPVVAAKAPNFERVTGSLNNITMLADGANLDLGKLIPTIRQLAMHPILRDADNFVYEERHVSPLAKIVDNLNNAIKLPDFKMVDQEDADTIRQLIDYLSSFGKKTANALKKEEKQKEQPKEEVVDKTKENVKKTETPTREQTTSTSTSRGIQSYEHNYTKGLAGLSQESALETIVAKDSTLQSILGAINSGITVKSDKGGGGGKKGGKKKSDDKPLNVTADDAWKTAQDYIKTNYPNFTSLGSLRPVSGGYSIDVFQPKNLEAYAAAQQRVNALIAEGKQGTDDYNQALAQRNGLALEQEKVTLRIGNLNNEIQVTQEKTSFQNLALGVKVASKELQNVESILTQLHEIGALSFGVDGSPDSSISSVKKYLDNLTALQDYQRSLSPAQLFDPAVNQNLSNFTSALQNSRKEVMELIKSSSQLNIGEKIDTDKLKDGIKGLSDGDIKQVMQDIISSNTQLETSFKALTPVTNEFGEVIGYQLGYTLRTGKNSVQEMTAVLNPLTNELRVQKGAVKEVATGWQQFFSGLKGKVASIMQYLISITSIHDVFRYFSQGVQYVRDIDSSLTELKKVTDETDASYAKFLQDMSQTGGVIGATVSDLTTMAAEWARLGYTMQEAGELAKSTAILLNVSEFDDATQASEALISTMQAFQYTADESGHVVDVLNEVGNNFAVSSDGIATALQDSASALMEAGNNLEQSVALVAAANKVVQDPNSVGSALRTISLRLRGTSVSVLEEMGEETDGVVESVSKMQEKIEALTGVNILTDAGAYKDTYTILYEIGNVWEKMSDIDQAALLELMAGKNRANTLAAILGNMKDLEGAYKSALNAEGSAMRENEAYLDSIQGRVDLFTNALQTFWMNFLNTDFIKGVVDAGTSLLGFVDTFVGKLTAGLVALEAVKLVKNKFDFGQTFGDTVSSVKNVVNVIKTMTIGTKTLTVETLKQVAATKLGSEADAAALMKKIGLGSAIGLLTKERIKDSAAALTEAYRNGELAASQYMAMMSTMGLKTAIQGLWTVLLQNPLVAIAAAAAIVGVALDGFTTTAQEAADKAKEAFDNIQGAVSATESTIQSLESELSTINSTIDELSGKELSFAESQELDRLKKQREELEHSLKVQEQLLDLQTDTRNQQAVASMEAYTKAASQGAEETQKKWKNALTAIGAVAGFAIGAYFTGGLAVPAMLAAGGGILGNKSGELIGSKVKENDGTYDDWYDTYTKARETARAEEQKALEAYQKDSGNIKKLDAWREAQQKTMDIETEMYNHLSQMQGYYNELEYGQSAEIDKKLDEWYNFLDKFAIQEGASGAEQTALDRIFGENASKEIQDIEKQILEAAEAGTEFDFSAAINGCKELSDALNYIGLDAEDVKNYFTQIGEAATTGANFNISDYSSRINSISENISAYQSALESLESGTFTLSDFIALIEQFPELADGVDVSSKNFDGLSKNLRRAIRNSPDDLVDDLKALKSQLEATGKSTDSIEQLIAAMESMPEDALSGVISQYVTLADEIERARQKQIGLQEAMSKNPNEGFETRGEAMEYMKDKMGRGEIGSTSELWDVAAEYGYVYDHTKDINANADALADFIAIRDKWFAKNDEGQYTFEGTEDFIQSVENAINDPKFKSAMEEAGLSADDFIWNYDDTTGAFAYDFDNKNIGAIVAALSKTGELSGLVSEEFHDMMTQIGQYYELKPEDEDDILHHLNEIADSSSNAKTKVEEYGDVMQAAFGKDTKIDLTNRPRLETEDGGYETVASVAFSNSEGTVALTVTPILPDGTKLSPEDLETYTNDILAGADPSTYEFTVEGKTYTGDDIILAKHEGPDAIEQANRYGTALHEAQEEYYALVDEAESNPFSINMEGDIETDIINPLTEAGLQVESVINEAGNKEFKFDVVEFHELMSDAGYTPENMTAILDKIFGQDNEYSDLVQLREDVLSIGSVSDDTLAKLQAIGADPIVRGNAQGATITITGNIDQILSDLQFTDSEIEALKQKWEANGIKIPSKVDDQGISDVSNELADPEQLTVNLGGDALDNINAMQSALTSMTSKVHDVTVNIKRNGILPDLAAVTAAAGANGTAHATGSWGAPATETALVGELGPEMLVRNGRWTTVGNNGAEFTQVKKGDIIFNHKQTQDLLSKGYVTGRGKLHGGAFASGTAYMSGGGTFGRYEFDGNGGWKEYDVNNKLVDSADGLAAAADALADATDEFKEVFDWIEVRIEELDETLSLLESQIENAIYYNEKNTIIDDLIKTNKTKLENLEAGYNKYAEFATELLKEVPEQYRDAVQNGAIDIEAFVGEDNEKALEAINNYREWAQKAADFKQQANEIITTIRDLAIQKFDNAYTHGDVRATVEDSQTEKLQNQINLLEEMGEIASTVYYGINGGDAASSTGMFENSYKKIEYLTEARDAMQKELDEAVKAGEIERGSNEWYDLVNQMYEVDAQIHDARVEIEEFQNAINDIYWENFDQLISRIDYLKDETQSLIDLMSHEDLVVDPVKRKYENGTVEYWTADDVNWSEEGLASLGLYAQQMEISEYRARQYAKAIDDLTKEYNAGHYSENEYYEKLNELKDAQYESIEAYYDAQDAIKDLNATRIDSIKKGIDKEIEAYEELIKTKKELLDSEKDAHDFQKTVVEQQKNISDIERKLAALAYDNSASARAQRAKLEAELADARAELDETYYDRSIEEQQNALDKELENFQKEKDAEVTKMEEYLEDIKKVVADSLLVVQGNASGIYDTLADKAAEYNLTLSDSIMSPWQDGSLAVSGYQETFDTAMSSTMDQLDALKNKWQEVIDKMVEAGNTSVQAIEKENKQYATATKKEQAAPAPKPTTTTAPVKQETKSNERTEQDYYGIALATLYGSYGWGNGADRMRQYKEKGFDYDKAQGIVNKLWSEGLVRNGTWEGKYYGITKKDLDKYHYNKFAKGTKGVDKDQLAIIDELGEELRLVPDGNGRLAYLSKGTSVIPADMTANLMEWGELDPADMLERNRPQIGASPSVINNTTEIHIDASVGELLHVEHLDGNNPAELTKVIDKAWDKRMKELNGYIRRYTNR